MLESPDDQCRTAVTRGNFESSCGLAGVFSGSLADSPSLSGDSVGLIVTVGDEAFGRVEAIGSADG